MAKVDITNQELMTRNLITLAEDRPLSEAYELMQQNEIRHLLVTGGSGQITGILSDRDVKLAMQPKSEGPTQGSGGKNKIYFTFNPGFKVRDFMSSPIQSVSERQSIEDTARSMLFSKISAVLVLGPASEPKGVITTDDLLRILIWILESQPSKTSLPISTLWEGDHPDLGYLN